MRNGSTFQVTKRLGSYPWVHAEDNGRGVVSHAGAILLVETLRKIGLDSASSAVFAGGRKRVVSAPPGTKYAHTSGGWPGTQHRTPTVR